MLWMAAWITLPACSEIAPQPVNQVRNAFEAPWAVFRRAVMASG